MRATTIGVMIIWMGAAAINMWAYLSERQPISASIVIICLCAFTINGIAEICHTIKGSKQ